MELRTLGWAFVALLTLQTCWSVFRHPHVYSGLLAREKNELDDVRKGVFLKYTNQCMTWAVISDALKFSTAVALGFFLILS